MDRRDFLKALTYSGLAAVPWGRPARAQTYDGYLWVMVNAAGGWDPTSLCDPKGRANETVEDPMNMYFSGDIETAGRISYAPVAGNAAFFQKHYQRLLVVNGVDTETNGHDSGSRHTWSGFLSEGYPAISALIAGARGPEKPLAFVTNGGYDVTQGLVAPTRTGNTGVLSRIAFPNRLDPNNDDSNLLPASIMARVRHAQRERLSKLMQRQKLPSVRQDMGLLHTVRTGDNEIRRLMEYLPDLDNSGNRLRRQAQLAIAGYRAGVTISANLSIGGFDTHGNHDASHFPRLQQLTEGIDFLLEEAERQGVIDRMVVVVGSDFGRTPGYNSGNGKDHWSITSMMLMGPGITGNRVIGATDERHRPYKVNPDSLALDDSGVRIKPAHIHRALRGLAGLSGHEVEQQFPLAVEPMPILG